MEDVQRKFQKKYMIITIIVCILLAVVGGYLIAKEVISNNNEATENKKETITLEVGKIVFLNQYIENIDEVENAVFEKTDVFSIDAEYIIKALSEGNDSLVVTYKDGTNEVLTFESIEVTELRMNLQETIYLGDYIENIENVESASFVDDSMFTIKDNYITANHGGIDELFITYKDGTTKTVRIYCDVTTLELEVGQTVKLSDYIEDIVSVSSATVSDVSVFTVENNVVTALQEGSAILTVTYIDGTTELMDLICKVKNSNATGSLHTIDIKTEQNGRVYVTKTIYAKLNSRGQYDYYSDASYTNRIYQIDLSKYYITSDNGKIQNAMLIAGYYGPLTDEDGYLQQPPKGDITSFWETNILYAWAEGIVKITLYDQNGSYRNSVLVVKYNASNISYATSMNKNITKVKIPKKPGYIFAGYYTDTGYEVISSTGQFNETWINAFLQFQTNNNVYARWYRDNNRYPTSSYRGY